MGLLDDVSYDVPHSVIFLIYVLINHLQVKTFSSVLFLNNFHLCSSLRLRDKVSRESVRGITAHMCRTP